MRWLQSSFDDLEVDQWWKVVVNKGTTCEKLWNWHLGKTAHNITSLVQIDDIKKHDVKVKKEKHIAGLKKKINNCLDKNWTQKENDGDIKPQVWEALVLEADSGCAE